jgi:hypothetical protein
MHMLRKDTYLCMPNTNVIQCSRTFLSLENNLLLLAGLSCKLFWLRQVSEKALYYSLLWYTLEAKIRICCIRAVQHLFRQSTQHSNVKLQLRTYISAFSLCLLIRISELNCKLWVSYDLLATQYSWTPKEFEFFHKRRTRLCNWNISTYILVSII